MDLCDQYAGLAWIQLRYEHLAASEQRLAAPDPLGCLVLAIDRYVQDRDAVMEDRVTQARRYDSLALSIGDPIESNPAPLGHAVTSRSRCWISSSSALISASISSSGRG